MRSIPEVPLERRREILSLRGGTAVHAALLAELGFDSVLEIAHPIAPEADRGEALRVVAWNAQRCRDPEASAALLRRTGFAVTHIDEWGPSHEQVAAQPELAAERERPPFLLMACRRA